MSVLLLQTFVPGRPAPKGSMDVMPNGRLMQNNERSDEWQATVANACRREVATLPGRPGRWVMQDGYPVTSPVVVSLVFAFLMPSKPKFPVPATVKTGDIDKLTRAVLDALTVAGVYADDALVCESHQWARYVPTKDLEGVAIEVRAL